MANIQDIVTGQQLKPFDHDTKNILKSMSIIDIGTIEHIQDDGRCSVRTFRNSGGEDICYEDVEMIFPNGIGIPATSGYCLVLKPVVPVTGLDGCYVDSAGDPYGTNGAKCIPIMSNSTRTVLAGIDNSGQFTVQGTGVSFTVSDSKITISAGGNTYSWDSDGTVDQSSGGGLVDTGSGEGTLRYRIYDSDGYTMLFDLFVDSTGEVTLQLTEASAKKVNILVGGNKISVTDNEDDGKHIIVEDANGDPDDDDSHGNIITMDESGVQVIDINENTVTLNSDGIDVTDANGNSFTMSSDGIVEQTNSDALLEIGNQVATLGGLLQELAQDLISASTVGSPSAHTMDPGTQANLQSWMQKMQQVFS